MSQKFGQFGENCGTVRTVWTLVWLHCLFQDICATGHSPPRGSQSDTTLGKSGWWDSSMQKKLDFVVCTSKFWAANWAEVDQKSGPVCIAQLPSFAKVWDFPQCMFFEVVPIVPFCPPSLYSDHKASSHSSFVCFVCTVIPCSFDYWKGETIQIMLQLQ